MFLRGSWKRGLQEYGHTFISNRIKHWKMIFFSPFMHFQCMSVLTLFMLAQTQNNCHIYRNKTYIMTTILEAPYMMLKKQDPGEPPLQVYTHLKFSIVVILYFTAPVIWHQFRWKIFFGNFLRLSILTFFVNYFCLHNKLSILIAIYKHIWVCSKV